MSTSNQTITPLRQRMIDDMRVRNLADNTQSAYLQQVTAYADYFHRSPDELDQEAIRAYQVYLTKTRKTVSEQHQCGYRRAALFVQSHAQTRLGH